MVQKSVNYISKHAVLGVFYFYEKAIIQQALNDITLDTQPSFLCKIIIKNNANVTSLYL